MTNGRTPTPSCAEAGSRRRSRCGRPPVDNDEDPTRTTAADRRRLHASRSARARSPAGSRSWPALVVLARAPHAGRQEELTPCPSSRRSRRPRSLAEAYAAARRLDGRRPDHADRRRHRRDGPDHRRDRRAAGPDARPVAARRAARDRDRRRRGQLGALTTYTEIRRSAPCREHLPALVEAAATIGAAQIQNRGTLGGNIANASPAGDTLPVLLALDAEIVVGGPRGERTIPATDFWVAYRRTALAPGRADPPGPDPGRRRPRGALPEGRDAAGPGDQQGRARRRLARAAAGRRGLARRPASPSGSVARPADPGAAHRGRPRGRRADARDRRRRRRGAGRRDPPDRRRPLDRRLPPGRRGAGPPPDGPRRRRLVARPSRGRARDRRTRSTASGPAAGARSGSARRSPPSRPELAADVAAPPLAGERARPTSRSSAAATPGCGPRSGCASSTPAARIVVVEQDICGGGPSGRNGGFVTGWWDELPALINRFGEAEAVRTARALDEAIDALGPWCAAHGVDAW